MKYLKLLLLSLLIPFIANSQNYGNTKSVTKDSYPNAAYVTIFDSTSVFMEETGLSHVTMHSLKKVLTYEGAKRLKAVKLDYDPQSAYVEIREVKIHHKDGNVTTVKEPVLDYVAPARAIYWGAKQKMVDLGRLEPGDMVEVKSYRKGFTYALLLDDDSRYIPPMKGHYYDIVPFWTDEPIIEKVYTLNILKSKKLQYKIYNGEVKTVKTDYNKDNAREVYTFSKKDIMPIKHVPYQVSNSDFQTKLLMSTSPDWEAKSRWFYGVNEDYGSFDPYPELQEKVNELLKDAKTELDSISILTHWVADYMRYSGLSMGEGEGFTLHNARMNFTDRCGVCKDKASLLIAMLRAAGFESYAAMTMAGERIDDIPADQFNHSVTVVKRRNGEWELLDPTWVPNVRELWSSAEQQQQYLMGLPEGAGLMTTPISAPENHYIRITGNSKINNEGTLTSEITITAEGQSDNAVRRVFSARYQDWYRYVEKELLQVVPNAEIISINYTDSDKYLERPVEIKYSFRVSNYATVTDEEIIFTPITALPLFKRAMPHLNYDTTLEKREQQFKDRCSRLVQLEETITVPTFKSVATNIKPQDVKSEHIKYEGGYMIEGNMIKLKQTASFGKRIYEASEWEPYKETVQALKKFADESLILLK